MKLTIAIPTYNRFSCLEECLKSIILQISEEVDIVISDNASTDGTEVKIQKYLEYPFIHYFRNETNLGMDGNFLNCLKKANGEYIHLMSDDDIMLPGTVFEIIKCINESKPDFIHLNSCSFEDDFQGVEKCSKPRLKMNENLITNDKTLFINKVGIFITFLSAMVLKKKLVKEIDEPEQFMGTYFLQSHIAILSTNGDKKLAILKHNAIAARGGNTGGYNLYKIWIVEYKKLLLNTGIKAGYDKACMRRIYLKSIRKEIKNFILSFRTFNTGLALDGRKYFVKNTYNHPTTWPVYFFAFAPVGMLKFFIVFKKTVKKLMKK